MTVAKTSHVACRRSPASSSHDDLRRLWVGGGRCGRMVGGAMSHRAAMPEILAASSYCGQLWPAGLANQNRRIRQLEGDQADDLRVVRVEWQSILTTRTAARRPSRFSGITNAKHQHVRALLSNYPLANGHIPISNSSPRARLSLCVISQFERLNQRGVQLSSLPLRSGPGSPYYLPHRHKP